MQQFHAYSYYDKRFIALEDDFKSSNIAEIETWCHEKLMNGNYIVINEEFTNLSVDINPDIYYENFDGEFYNTDELIKWYRQIFGFFTFK